MKRNDDATMLPRRERELTQCAWGVDSCYWDRHHAIISLGAIARSVLLMLVAYYVGSDYALPFCEMRLKDKVLLGAVTIYGVMECELLSAA